MNGRALISAGLLIAACHSAPQDATSLTTAVAVETAIVARDTIGQTIALFGRVEPPPGGSVTLSAPTDAVARAVPARIGQQVHPGDLLVDLDAPEWTTQAQSLRAAAQAADLEAARQRELFQQGISARRRLEEAEASATGARSAAEAAERLLGRTKVASPIAGRVERVLVQPGERVTGGAPLAEVVNGSALDLVASVAPGDLRRILVGQRATVVGEGSSDAQRGWVRAIAPAVDSMTGTGTVIVRIPNASAALLPGAGAVARVELPPLRDVLLVPDSALVLVGNGLHVFVIGADSVAHARAVSVLGRSGGRAAVSGELQPGERVATAGAYGLADGMHVRPGSGLQP